MNFNARFESWPGHYSRKTVALPFARSKNVVNPAESCSNDDMTNSGARRVFRKQRTGIHVPGAGAMAWRGTVTI